VTRAIRNAKTQEKVTHMKKLTAIILPVLAGALVGILSARLCTGCTALEGVREEARPAVLFVLKEAYASGGAEAVSNRIEQLAADGKVAPEQAANLHRLAQGLYDGVVDRLESKVIEDALAATNAPAAMPVAR
jgi:hypothetical protein